MSNTIQESPITTVSIADRAPYRDGLFVGDVWYEETREMGQPKTIVAAYKWDGQQWNPQAVEHKKIAEVDLLQVSESMLSRMERIERWIESQDTMAAKIIEESRRRNANDPNWP